MPECRKHLYPLHFALSLLIEASSLHFLSEVLIPVTRSCMMNCYLCLVETRCYHRPAFALCQRCGAGVCAEHLVELTFTPVIGMGGDSCPRQSLICRRCYRSTVRSSGPSQPQSHLARQDKQEPSRGWNVWHWLRGRQQSELPEPGDAVAAAELLLKRQRNQ